MHLHEQGGANTNLNESNWKISNWRVVIFKEKISCSGEISKWHFYAQKSKSFNAVVFKPSTDTAMIVRGINRVPSTYVIPNQTSTYVVPFNERIIVRPGDRIAIQTGSSRYNPIFPLYDAPWDAIQYFGYNASQLADWELEKGRSYLLAPRSPFNERFSTLFYATITNEAQGNYVLTWKKV